MLKKRSRAVSTTKLQNPLFVGFFTDTTMSPTSVLEPKTPIGLGIAEALKESSLPVTRLVLFGSQLKVQIPSITTNDSPQSPIEFGIKNKKSQLALLSPALKSPMSFASSMPQSISATDMELSDDYTCVIAHGPNPRTTHIFDNCIIESCCGREEFAPRTPSQGSGFPGEDFLTSCHACKKSLGQGKDIFMYRGEKAFCSRECRYHQILLDEGMDESSSP